MTTFVPTNQIIGEYDDEQAIQHLQGGTRFRVPARVLHGARGATHDRMRRNAWETGELTRMIDLPYFPNICCPI